MAETFAGRFPIPAGCVAATVELRGEADVDHALARIDAAALYAFLQHRARGIPGAWIERDEPVVHVIDPISGATQVVCSTTCGVMYMRGAIRFAAAGVELCKVAGATALEGGVRVSA